MDKPVPEALRKVGIKTLSDNIPDGFGIDFASDFVRLFRDEIEEKLYGWKRPAPPVLRRFPRAGHETV